MNKRRCMIGTATLDKAMAYMDKHIPIATIVKVLKLDRTLHYRTAYNIIAADRRKLYHVTRPSWLGSTPKIQQPPDGWNLTGKITEKGVWTYKPNKIS